MNTMLIMERIVKDNVVEHLNEYNVNYGEIVKDNVVEHLNEYNVIKGAANTDLLEVAHV